MDLLTTLSSDYVNFLPSLLLLLPLLLSLSFQFTPLLAYFDPICVYICKLLGLDLLTLFVVTSALIWQFWSPVWWWVSISVHLSLFFSTIVNFFSCQVWIWICEPHRVTIIYSMFPACLSRPLDHFLLPVLLFTSHHFVMQVVHLHLLHRKDTGISKPHF